MDILRMYNDSLAMHPFISTGIIFGTGIVLGFLLKSKKKS